MKTKLLLFCILWITLATGHADTSVTIVTKAPIEQLASDGSVSGVSTSTPGNHYTLVRYQAVGIDGKPVVIIADSTGQQYRIVVAATDYQPAPAAAPTNAPPVANVPAVPNTPPSSALPPPNEADVATFLDKSGISARFDRLLTKFATPATRHLNDQDDSDVQAFKASFKTPETRSKYQALFIDAATKDYTQLSADDLAAINTFLGSPQAAADAVIVPAIVEEQGDLSPCCCLWNYLRRT